MGDKLGPAKFDFDFEPFDTGIYTFKAKEVDIQKVVDKPDSKDDEDRKGPKNDFNFIIVLQAEGGEMDGKLHYERFAHIMQGHMGLKKLEACMIKMEAIKPSQDPQGRDTGSFDTDEFKKMFKMVVPGRKVVAIVRRKTAKSGGEFSNIVAFYHVNEYKMALEDFNRKFKKAGAVGDSAKTATVTLLPGMESTPLPASSDW